MSSHFETQRSLFHAALLKGVLSVNAKGVPSNADSHSAISVKIARGILEKLGGSSQVERLAGQTSGNTFEQSCTTFLQQTFHELTHLRPGKWTIGRDIAGGRLAIAAFEQYEHLAALNAIAETNRELRVALGSDYLIKPDILIARRPEADGDINSNDDLISQNVAKGASLRQSYNSKPILHASISCKWTIRSDRSQNSRTEALNLIRNRKGRVPHIVVITGEPWPNRISSIALGTGDIDCVYHFALYELIDTVSVLEDESCADLLQMLISGKRLKDISDLPLDLAT